jgi:transcriptional repressor NrdR
VEVAVKCPRCTAADTKVIDSREVREGVRRRRECVACGYRFTTRERFDFAPISVQKRNGRAEPFDRGKIVTAVKLVVGKRPVSLAAIEALAFDVERAFMSVAGDAKVGTAEIARTVARELTRLDPIAGRRFAASYHETDAGQLAKLDTGEAKPAARQLPLFDGPTERKR